MTTPLERLSAALADRYRIDRELGTGGMATVYLAEDLRHRRRVAVKVLRPDLAAALGPERFLREVEIAAQLQHPHILTLIDSGEADGFLYYVMPFVEGESLRAKLTRERELPVGETVRLLKEVADALAHAHAHGVVHRDIKPDNVLLSGQHAVVTDFGVAKAVSEATGRQSLTTAGVALGTPAYMAPEQATADPHTDHRADIYALGAMAYEMLTGSPPFTGASPQMVLAAHVTQAPEPVGTHRAAVPAPLAELVMRCLEKKPADRWQTAQEVLTHLEAAATPTLGITPTDTRPLPAQPPRGPRRRWAMIGVGAAVVLLGVAGWLALRPTPGNGPTRGKLPRLVVLPFENLGAAEDEYFADGITEEITSKLAGLSGLGVIARTSAVQYKKTTKPVRQIGDELKVDYLLEGTVRWDKAGGRVRVSPQLIRVSDETHVWAEAQEGAFSDVFRFQAQVADRVREAMDVTVLQRERQALAAPRTTSDEAYQWFLRAEAIATRAGGPDDFRQATQLYERAVTLDSTFALAYARLSDLYSLSASWQMAEHQDFLGDAKAAATRAQVLQPDLPEAHLAFASYYYNGPGDVKRALQEAQLARSQRPNDPAVLSVLGSYLANRGDFKDAAQVLAQAHELDPRNAAAVGWLGTLHLSTGQYAEAHRDVDLFVALSLPSAGAYWLDAFTYAAEGNEAEARRVAQEGIRRLGIAKLFAEGYYMWWSMVRWLNDENRTKLDQLELTSAFSRPDLYYLTKAENSRLSGNRGRSLIMYDSAASAFRAALARPHKSVILEAELRSELGIALARLGLKADAIREGMAATDLVPLSMSVLNGMDYAIRLADVYLIVGEPASALKELEAAWPVPGVAEQYLWKLRTDDVYAPLRGNPRFEKLLAKRVAVQ